MMFGKTTLNFLIVFFFVFIGNINVYANRIIDVAPPANDDCANATTLTVNPNYLCGTVTSGTLLDATASSLASDGNTGTCPNVSTRANDDVWFKFVATDTSHRLEILNIAGNNTNLYTNVYDGGISANCPSVAADIPIQCSDPETVNMSSLTIGNTYFIRIYSNSSAAGATTTFDVCVGSMPSVPVNDECANADVITSLPHNQSYDATSATNTGGSVSVPSCMSMNDGVWYKITGNGGTITIIGSPTSWNLSMAVYTGSCGSFTCVGFSDDYTSDATEGLSFTSTNGTTYYINIGYGGALDGAEGVFDLAITSSTLSIDDLLAKGFSYYPNPVDKVLNMNAKEPIQQIILYSVKGEEIKRINQNDLQAELNLDHLSTGTYFVKAFVGGSTGTFKIIKK